MRTLVAIVVLGMSVSCGWSQGQVDFRNGATLTFATVADRLVRDLCNAPLTGTNYVAGLWYNVGNNTDFNGPDKGRQAGVVFHFRPPTSPFKGIWLVPAGTSSLFTLDGVAASGPESARTATLQVRVWDSVRYADFAAAFAGGSYYMSAPFAYVAPDATSGTVTPDKYYMENLRGIYIPFPVCPEPSTVVIGMVGAVLLVLYRRRGGAKVS